MNDIPVQTLSVKERILLHLLKYPSEGPEVGYSAPFALTQDGIAGAVGITRAHASMGLKEMGEMGTVTRQKAHVKGSRSKRYTYCLTSKGYTRAVILAGRVEDFDVGPETLDRFVSCAENLDNLSPADITAVGKACVLRIPIPRIDIPACQRIFIPADERGNLDIKRKTAESFLSMADPAALREWHGWAGDLWRDRGNLRECLHHYVASGRNADACRIVLDNERSIMAAADWKMLEPISGLEPLPEDAAQIYWIAAEVAYGSLRMETAVEYANKLIGLNDIRGNLVLSQVYLQRSMIPLCVANAELVNRNTQYPLAAIVLAKAMEADHDSDSALRCLDEACRKMISNNDLSFLDEVFRIRAGIAYAMKDPKSALFFLDLARPLAPPYRRRGIDKLMDDIKKGKNNLHLVRLGKPCSSSANQCH